MEEPPTGTEAVACERCAQDPGDGRYCTTCGLDLRLGEPTLPTEEALAAADRAVGYPPDERRAPAPVARAEGTSDDVEDESACLTCGRPPGTGRYCQACAVDLRPGEAEPVSRADLETYRSPRIPALVATRWIVVVSLLSIGVALLDIHELSVVGPDMTLAEADSIDRVNLVTTIAWYAIYLVSAVIFVVWFRRAYRNLPSLGIVDPRYGSAWTGWGWVLPIVNFFRPKQIANDIWRSGETASPEVKYWIDRPVARLVHWWWAAWIVTILLDRWASLSYRNAADLASLEDALLLDAVFSGSFAVCGVLVVAVIHRMTARQDARAAQLESAADAAAGQAAVA